MSEPIVNEGFHAHRLDPKQNNPREVAFAKAWRRENSQEFTSHVLAELLVMRTGNDPFNPFSGKVKQLAPLDQQSASVAATVIQWLGSNVGFSFLEEALKACGYKIVPIKPTNALRQSDGKGGI